MLRGGGQAQGLQGLGEGDRVVDRGNPWARPLLHDRPDGAAVDQSDEASVDLDRVAEGDHGATQDALGVQVRAELAQQVVEQLLLGCVTLQLRLGFLQLLDRVVEVGGRVLTDALGSDPGPPFALQTPSQQRRLGDGVSRWARVRHPGLRR